MDFSESWVVFSRCASSCLYPGGLLSQGELVRASPLIPQKPTGKVPVWIGPNVFHMHPGSYLHYLVPRLGTKYSVPSTWCQVLGTKYLVPSTWYQVLGTKYLVRTWTPVLVTKYLVPKYLVPSTWYQVLRTKYLVPSTLESLLLRGVNPPLGL